MKKLLARWRNADPAFKAFLIGVFFLGINAGVLSAAFNNYLHDSFNLTSKQRGFLEFPRELPGFLVIFMTGLLAALPVRKWAVITSLLTAVGVAGLGFMSPSYNMMLVWMLLWSAGSHLFMTVEGVMGLRFSKEGGHGRRLGQISGMTNFAAVAGAGFVWAVAKLAGPAIYRWSFFAAAVSSLVSAAMFARMKTAAEDSAPAGKRFIFRWKYKWFYLLNIFFGARKQIFLTFAPWVLVTVYGASPAVMAALALTAAGLGVFFRQGFGEIVDKFGERKVLAGDGILLLFICGGFAYLSFKPALYALFIIDNLMFAMRIPRTTYLNRIAEHKSDIAPSLSLGVTMDHAVSMIIPAAGGLLWAACGYKAVFIAASGLAAGIFFVSLGVDERPRRAAAAPLPAPAAQDGCC